MSFCTASSGRSPFVSANASVSAGTSGGSCAKSAVAPRDTAPASTPATRVRAPPSVAVGGGDDLTGAQPPHPREMMAVVALDGDDVVEALDVDVRTSGHVGGAEVRAHPIHAARYWNADRSREKTPFSCWRRDFFAAHRRERAQQFVFFGGEPAGHVDVDAHEQIAATSTTERGNTASLESEHVAGLGARGHDELFGALERLDVEAGAQRHLRERETPYVQQIVAFALEARIGRDAHRDVEIAGDPTAWRGRASARQAEPLAVVDTGRHLDVDRPRRAHASVASALVARSGNAAAGGAARDARRRGDDLAEDGAADLAHLAGTAAHVAPRRVGAGLAARALAARARDRESDVDGRGGAERGLGEIEVYDRLGVGRAGRAALAATAEGIAAEERVEEVAEPERIAGRPAGAPAVARVPSSPKTS